MSEHLKILYLCTGNICRSPTAELLSRQLFGDDNVKFRSAGFIAEGQRCPQKLVDVLAQQGVDATHHRSYQVGAPSLEEADLVLTMEATHVQKSTLISRDCFSKVFPLREVAELLSSGIFGGLDHFLADVNSGRDPFRYMETRWDVDDPYGRSSSNYRSAVEEISALVHTVGESIVDLSRVQRTNS